MGIGLSDGVIKIVDFLIMKVVKVLKGYHGKSIDYLVSYKQNMN